MTLNGQNALCRRKEKMRILEPTAQIGMKIDPYTISDKNVGQ